MGGSFGDGGGVDGRSQSDSLFQIDGSAMLFDVENVYALHQSREGLHDGMPCYLCRFQSKHEDERPKRRGWIGFLCAIDE